LPLVWGSLTELERSVRTGRPGLDALDPKGIRAYLQDRPVEADVFGRAMSAKADVDVAAVVGSYDFTPFETIADIGGGRGHLLRAVLDATPGAAGILFDLPAVIDTLEGGHLRMAATAGDFFVDALPAADAYVLMDVLHDWADDQCVAILGAVWRAAPADAVLLVVENVLDERGPDPGRGTLDVLMLAVTGGRERTAAQLSALFDRAGLALVRVVDTTGPMRIVEARPA
jgi:C-methyltransferase